MDEKTCNEKMSAIAERIDRNELRINNHSDRIKFIEKEIVGMKRDTSRLEQIMNKLELAIDKLNETINEMKYKPLKFYEQIIMGVIMLVVGYLFAKLTK